MCLLARHPLCSLLMGRTQKLTGDPTKARPHEAGASVIVVQTLAHNRLGAISYSWPRQWVFHARAAQAAFGELTALHQRLVEFPVHEPTAMRSILDMDYLEAVYRAGAQMVIEAILTLQHLCEEIERGVKVQLQEPTLDGSLREALQNAGMTPPPQRRGTPSSLNLKLFVMPSSTPRWRTSTTDSPDSGTACHLPGFSRNVGWQHSRDGISSLDRSQTTGKSAGTSSLGQLS